MVEDFSTQFNPFLPMKYSEFFLHIPSSQKFDYLTIQTEKQTDKNYRKIIQRKDRSFDRPL